MGFGGVCVASPPPPPPMDIQRERDAARGEFRLLWLIITPGKGRENFLQLPSLPFPRLESESELFVGCDGLATYMHWKFPIFFHPFHAST